MSEDLRSKTCVPCRGGVPPLPRSEVDAYLAKAPGWELCDEGKRIERAFKFGDFKQALDFVDRVGAVSEEQGHHPDISFGWGWASVSWQTKKINGLHDNDFIMAAKTDKLFGA